MHLKRFSSLVVALLLSFHAAFAAEEVDKLALVAKIPTNNPIVPGPRDADIARLTGRLLERQHFSQMPFDKAVSAKFLDRYLESLDNQRLHFLQSDIEEFNILLAGDVSPLLMVRSSSWSR